MKCVHSGTAPCQRCQNSEIDGCVLSRPVNKTPQKPRRRPQSTNHPYERPVQQDEPEPRRTRPPEEVDTTVQPDASSPGQCIDKSTVDRHLTNLSGDVILKSLNGFTGKHPELAILNHAAFVKEYQSSPIPPESKIVLAAILASSRSQFSLLNLPWVDSLLPREHYACYAHEMLSEWSFKPPKLQVAQALLIMSLYEWGSREFHRAWIYCGTTYLTLSKRTMI